MRQRREGNKWVPGKCAKHPGALRFTAKLVAKWFAVMKKAAGDIQAAQKAVGL